MRIWPQNASCIVAVVVVAFETRAHESTSGVDVRVARARVSAMTIVVRAIRVVVITKVVFGRSPTPHVREKDPRLHAKNAGGRWGVSAGGGTGKTGVARKRLGLR